MLTRVTVGYKKIRGLRSVYSKCAHGSSCAGLSTIANSQTRRPELSTCALPPCPLGDEHPHVSLYMMQWRHSVHEFMTSPKTNYYINLSYIYFVMLRNIRLLTYCTVLLCFGPFIYLSDIRHFLYIFSVTQQ